MGVLEKETHNPCKSLLKKKIQKSILISNYILECTSERKINKLLKSKQFERKRKKKLPAYYV
jgi:hypothetical protein